MYDEHGYVVLPAHQWAGRSEAPPNPASWILNMHYNNDNRRTILPTVQQVNTITPYMLHEVYNQPLHFPSHGWPPIANVPGPPRLEQYVPVAEPDVLPRWPLISTSNDPMSSLAGRLDKRLPQWPYISFPSSEFMSSLTLPASAPSVPAFLDSPHMSESDISTSSTDSYEPYETLTTGYEQPSSHAAYPEHTGTNVTQDPNVHPSEEVAAEENQQSPAEPEGVYLLLPYVHRKLYPEACTPIKFTSCGRVGFSVLEAWRCSSDCLDDPYSHAFDPDMPGIVYLKLCWRKGGTKHSTQFSVLRSTPQKAVDKNPATLHELAYAVALLVWKEFDTHSGGKPLEEQYIVLDGKRIFFKDLYVAELRQVSQTSFQPVLLARASA